MPAQPGINPSQLQLITEGDPDFIESLIRLFLETSVPQWEELGDAITAADTQKVAQLAHKLKPSLLTVGMDSLLEDILTLEHAQRNNLDPVIYASIFRQLDPVFRENLGLLKAFAKIH